MVSAGGRTRLKHTFPWWWGRIKGNFWNFFYLAILDLVKRIKRYYLSVQDRQETHPSFHSVQSSLPSFCCWIFFNIRVETFFLLRRSFDGWDLLLSNPEHSLQHNPDNKWIVVVWANRYSAVLPSLLHVLDTWMYNIAKHRYLESILA